MKLLLPLCSTALFLTACSSAPHREVWAPRQPYGRSDANATRRDLFSPNRASGPHTASLENGAWKKKGRSAEEEVAARQEQERIDALGAKPAAKPQ